jgi:RimJ/RimL family protein N-acetyltransferase
MGAARGTVGNILFVLSGRAMQKHRVDATELQELARLPNAVELTDDQGIMGIFVPLRTYLTMPTEKVDELLETAFNRIQPSLLYARQSQKKDLGLFPGQEMMGGCYRLRILSRTDIPDLEYAGRDSTIFRFMFDGPIILNHGMRTFVEQEVYKYEKEKSVLPFAIVRNEDNKTIGMTRFLNLQEDNLTVEIATWIGADDKGQSSANAESKYLMLGYAFDYAACDRVEFKVDVRNTDSLNSLEKFGATWEGVLRQHIKLADGSPRSSYVYSVLRDQWERETRPKFWSLLGKDRSKPKDKADGGDQTESSSKESSNE